MTKALKLDNAEKLNEKSDIFINKMSSEMHFKSELAMDSVSFEWVDKIEDACPYLDNIIRNPKLALINESDVVKIEKARKITVESVKDLSKHTHYIDKIDAETNEVHPSRILVLRREETYNTYENRFIYTLITNLSRFLMKKEAFLEEFDTRSDKTLEYAGTTNTTSERLNIQLKISSKELPQGQNGNNFENEIDSIRKRVKKIRDYITSWRRNEFMTSLDKAHVAFVIPPIKKTNMILKNPNFQIAMKLWEFLQHYDEKEKDNAKQGLDTTGNEVLKGLLDGSFLMDYFVFDSISQDKKEQKEKIAKYAVLMIKEQLQRIVSLLLNSGITISDEEIHSMISSEIKNEKNKRLVGSDDVKKKFKSAMDEYLERTQNYL
jgi:hypothetical protein